MQISPSPSMLYLCVGRVLLVFVIFGELGAPSQKQAVNVANALVSSRLDYCNSLLRSLSGRDLKKLQCVQNSLVRIVTRMPKYSRAHITPVLKSLHWLPIKQRIRFKTASIIFKFLHTGTPAYFSPHLTRYSCSVNTRRSNFDNLYLHVPGYKTTIKSKVQFQNSFSYDPLVVECFTSWNPFSPYIVKFQAKAKDIPVSGSISTINLAVMPIDCHPDNNHFCPPS